MFPIMQSALREWTWMKHVETLLESLCLYYCAPTMVEGTPHVVLDEEILEKSIEDADSVLIRLFNKR